jgi:tetratricopeptide (TPR) repeat protein
MAEEDFREFVKGLCSEVSIRDLLRNWGENIFSLIPYAGQYFTANMSSFEHEIQLRAIKKVIDSQEDIKVLLKGQAEDFLDIVRKFEKKTYPFKIFNITQIEDIQSELNWNPGFLRQYLPIEELENISLDRNILLKGKIGIGKTRNILRLMERAHIETVIVVMEYVKTLGVERFENLDFQDRALLIWDDVHRAPEEFLKALPYLKTKDNLLVLAAIRSTDYEKIEKDATIREETFFLEINLELYQKNRTEKFVRLCEREFNTPLTDDLREALVERAMRGDATPLYVASIFAKEEHMTRDVIETLPDDVVKFWAKYFNDLTANERCFLKALKAAQLGYSPPYKELIESLYSKVFSGEPRDLAEVVASLKKELWIVEVSNYYDCLDAQLECFEFEDVDMRTVVKCLLEKEFVQEHHAQLLLGVGSHYFETKDYDLAIRLMDKAVKINPGLAEPYYNRGLAYREKGDYKMAIGDYSRAIEINLGYVEAYNNRGLAYSENGECEKAIEDYNRAIEISSDFAEAYYNRGNIYYKKEDYEKAIEDYNRAIATNSSYAKAYYNRGNIYYKKEDYEKAIEDYNRAIATNSSYAKAYYNRGNAYYRKGDYEKAIKDYERCAIQFLIEGAICDSVITFVQIFKLISQTETLKALCTECGLLASSLIHQYRETIDFTETLREFGYENLGPLVKDIHQCKTLMPSLYSRALLHKLHRIQISKDAEITEFLSPEEVVFLNEQSKKNVRDLAESMKEEREQLIVTALFS